MLYLDGYAQAYGAALLVTLAVSLFTRQRSRILGAGLLASGWIATLAFQVITGGIAAPLAMSVLDCGLVMGFVAVGFFNQETWPWRIAALHGAMGLAHFSYATVEPANPFVYLSVLAVLGYLSMCLIAVPPAFNWLRGRRNGTPDYWRFERDSVIRSSHVSTRQQHQSAKAATK